MANKFTAKSAQVVDGDIDVTVYGLSLNSIVQLLVVNRPAVEGLFEQFNGRDTDSIGDGEIATAAMSMIESAPSMVAHLIGLAARADMERDYDDILGLPVGVQIALLEKIGELTFAAGGGPKKMLALALKMLPAKSQSASPQ